MVLYPSKWRVKNTYRDGKTRKIWTCVCPEVVAALHQGPLAQRRDRDWFSSLETPQDLQEMQEQIPLGLSKTSDPSSCSWLWDLTLLFPPFCPGVEAATCAQNERVTPAIHETFPILLTKHFPYQPLHVQNPQSPEQAHFFVICGRIVAFQHLPMKGNC